MKHILPILLASLSLTSFGQTYYIVRHAEKAQNSDSTAMMSNDPPLQPVGVKRAEALRHLLKTKKIGYVFSTNTARTKATAEPTARQFGLTIRLYGPKPDSGFIQKLRTLKKNTMIVGHSNTVDDIVNGLCGAQLVFDLPDNEYDDLFIVVHKDGKYILQKEKYGRKSEVQSP